MKEHPIDSQFKQKFEGVEIRPSANVWERIDLQIERKRKPVGYWFSIAASFLVFVAIGTLVFNASISVEPLYYQEDIPVLEIVEEVPVLAPVVNKPEAKKRTIPVLSQQRSSDLAKEHTAIAQVGKVEKVVPTSKEDPALTEGAIETQVDRNVRKSKTVIIADASGYLKHTPEDEEISSYSKQLKEYSVAQWDNLKKGSAIQTPPKPIIKFKKPRFLQGQN